MPWDSMPEPEKIVFRYIWSKFDLFLFLSASKFLKDM